MPRTVKLEPIRHEPPVCASFADEGVVLRFEREVRVHRAHVEPFAITPVADDTFVVQGPSASEYVVDLVDGVLFDTCTCPDFLGNRLGTCKHLEAVRRIAPKKRRRSDRQDVVTVRADGRLRIVRLGEEREDARVTHAVPIAQRILDERAAFERRRRAIDRALRDGSLGLDVLSAPLFPYQREGVAHLVRAGRAVLADDMGLGKTVQTIAACELLRRRGEARRVLVVCPASLKAQWASEIARYAGARAVVVTGGVKERRAAFASDAPYVVLNYELTWRDLSILEGLETDVLVLDEAQRARNFRTKTAATLKRIPSKFLFVLTGTPVENRLDDLYSIMQLVDPEVLGPLWKFNVDFHRQDPGGKITGYKNLGELRRRIGPHVLRRRKEEVLSQLPALTEQVRYVPLSREQADLEASFRRVAAQLVAQAKKRPLSPQEQKRLQAAMLKARQACNAARLCDPASPDRGSAKLDELAALVTEVAAQGTSKMLVFSEWTEMLKLASERLDELGIGHLFLHGGVRSNERPALLDELRHDPAKKVLLSTDAGGVGLNLQVASYVVHLDLPWNPARIDQRVSRAHRLGQTRGVSVTYLCAESGIERDIATTLAGKRAVRSAALDADSDVEELDVAGASLAIAGLVGEPPAEEPAPIAPLEEAPLEKMDHARQRLRLARIVLDAGYPGDAARAAYEALGASLRWLLPPGAGSGYGDLLDAVCMHLVPSGTVPASMSATLARVHDLAEAAERGEAIDHGLVGRAVDETAEWIDRADRIALERGRRRAARR